MTFARGFAAEVHKGLLNLVAGWRESLVQLATFPVFYLLIVLFMGRGQLRAELLLPVLLGMVALTFIHEQVNRVFWSYLGDIQSGVLEQTYLTPLPSAALILGRQVAAVIAALPTALAVLATGVVAITVQDGAVPFDAQVIVPLAAIVIGTCGLAMILCGLTLVFKRIEIITQVSVAAYGIVGGTLVPLTAMPDPIAALSRLLVPIAPGIEAMRDILLGGHSLGTLPTGWGLGWLLVQPLLITAAGIFAFSRLEHLARRRGTLGRY
ncbi:ABC-type polysaccharide/polyol phosphate export permease [Actinokineospora alba]|uniref:ABC-type polysaccharide/polyol phosphate export permease n=1 Tax=Actinokineospora alba TaxID=504798 RepID=A0A1H0FTN4_9PSEU|nr:ABC-2 family transporter protein [Actinokineospora alba]TDP69611.1 ABC-type polysaccharide/polyol phosphate export permease [Actinokineospora alba]SDI12984.1 ABC-type polysaccharide/polyol phosphate export permease [Actinokineospora alba]SDN97997.1 ABC-type polysaccharide/polyol phosphate export permease [Actinokineospora alba]